DRATRSGPKRRGRDGFVEVDAPVVERLFDGADLGIGIVQVAARSSGGASGRAGLPGLGVAQALVVRGRFRAQNNLDRVFGRNFHVRDSGRVAAFVEVFE